MRLVGVVGGGECEIEFMPAAVVLDDVADLGLARLDVEPPKDADILFGIVDRLVDEMRVGFGELELGGGRAGLHDAPGYEDSGPGGADAGESKTEIAPKMLDLGPKRLVSLVDQMKLAVLIFRDLREPNTEWRRHDILPHIV